MDAGSRRGVGWLVRVTGGERGRVVAVHGAKGGVGASLLACQIAMAAADRAPVAGRASAALVDLDVTGGCASALLGLEERGSVLSLLGEDVAVGTVARAHRSGLALLAAEPFDAAADRLDGYAVRELLGWLRERYEVLVVDVPAEVDDRGVSALVSADVALLVVTPEVPCVLAARRLVDALARDRFPLERLGVLVNMHDPGGGVAPEQVARALSLELRGVVPFDRETVRAAVDGAAEHGGVLRPGAVRDAVAAVAAEVLPSAVTRPAGGMEWLAAGVGAAR